MSNAAGFVEPAGAQQFEDVVPGSTFYDFVWRLASRGYVNGYPCGGPGEPCISPDNLPYFRPNADVTRGQFSKIVVNAAGILEPAGAQQFEDVLPGSTFYDFIWVLANQNVVTATRAEDRASLAMPGTCPTSGRARQRREGKLVRSSLVRSAITAISLPGRRLLPGTGIEFFYISG